MTRSIEHDYSPNAYSKMHEDSCAPYLTRRLLLPTWLAKSFLKLLVFLLYFFLWGIPAFAPILAAFLYVLYGDIGLLLVFPLIFIGVFYLQHYVLTGAGLLGYFILDGNKWISTGSLDSNTGSAIEPVPAETILITSRFLVLPGPRSNLRDPLSFRYFLSFGYYAIFFSGLFLGLLAVQTTTGYNLSMVGYSLLALIALFIFLGIIKAIVFIVKSESRATQNRAINYMIFDRKESRVHYHRSVFSSRLKSIPWYELECRVINAGKSGYSAVLTHIRTGETLPVQSGDLRAHGARAGHTLSFISGFMDNRFALRDESIFSRYMKAEDPDESYEEYKKRKEAIISQHGMDERVAFFIANRASWNDLVLDHPWLSAKNVWMASAKYFRKPDWDKWVRDKWGFAANESIPQVKVIDQPEWLVALHKHIKADWKNQKYMTDHERALANQAWFEENFPEEHWVDPLTANL